MMAIDVIGLCYVGVGVVAAIALAAMRGISAGDAVLVVVLWPLYVPMTLASRDTGGELEAALRRAAASPLASALPDATTARELSRRLRDARARLAELDGVLARPDFDAAAAEARAGELAARGATAAAAAAQLRVKTLGQLRAVRARYRSELEEVGELIAQLVTQAELVRLGNAPASGELVAELVARVEGLGELLAHEAGGEYLPDPDRLGS